MSRNQRRLKLEETREVQNLRKRPNGVSAVALLVGEKVQEETTLVDDPLQMKTRQYGGHEETEGKRQK